MPIETIKLNAGKYRYPVRIFRDAGRIFFDFDYNVTLKDEIKAMQGSKFHGFDQTGKDAKAALGNTKIWSVLDCPRNHFQLSYLQGNNPYAWYDKPLQHFEPYRDCLQPHQHEFLDFTLTRRHCILGAEMRTRKTLVAFEVIERMNEWFPGTETWYIAPKGVLNEITRQMKFWQLKYPINLMTYEGLVKIISNLNGGMPPRVAIFDEFSRAKNPDAKRSQACQMLADAIRAAYRHDSIILGMSGSPAPKAPSDWWSLCEIICPGFLREGSVDQCQRRLAVFEEQESAQGMKFLKRKAWLDSDQRCKVCGELEPAHMLKFDHSFVPATNEVAKLYSRMSGLVHIKFKKDIVDLPPVEYRVINCKPTPSVLRAAKAIVGRGKGAAQTLILLRELSDGFQYQDTETGNLVNCDVCHGSGNYFDMEIDEGFSPDDPNATYSKVEGPCPYCDGGKVPEVSRTSAEVECPKEQVLRDVLDEYEEDGRLVAYAGFQASIDRFTRVGLSEGWVVIKVDGRGWSMHNPDGTINPSKDYLGVFQDQREAFPKVLFLGQPSSCGMGLTLDAAQGIIYLSQDFNGESRIQSIERIFNLDAEHCRGCEVIDVVHLPQDQLVIDNLKAKKSLMHMTMGELSEASNYTGERLF